MSGFRTADPLGVGLALFSTVIWALYWIANTRSPLEPVTGLWWNFAGALLPVTAVTLLTDGLVLPAAGLAGGAYVGVFEMGLTFVLWGKALKLAENTSRVANLIFLSPFLSLLLIQFVLKEPVRPATVAGLGLIVGGLVWQGRGRK